MKTKAAKPLTNLNQIQILSHSAQTFGGTGLINTRNAKYSLTQKTNFKILYYSAQSFGGVGRTNMRSDWVVLDFLFLLYQDKRKEYNLAAFNYNEN